MSGRGGRAVARVVFALAGLFLIWWLLVGIGGLVQLLLLAAIPVAYAFKPDSPFGPCP